jgi:hypothetical protein
MQKVASVSLMFDEASDIQMYKHLNIFVNVSTYNLSFSQHVVVLYFIVFIACYCTLFYPKGIIICVLYLLIYT